MPDSPNPGESLSEPLYDRVVAALGRQYEIEGEIGRGGMSVVYRARDLRLNRPVAIKVLPPELAHDPAIRARFTREGQTSAQLSHPHIVPIYDVGENDGIAFLVMAIVTGGNLAALLTREPQQPVAEVRRLLGEISDALAYAHLRGVIHRDIKPDNILLDRETGRAMVTDFGIAWAMEAATRLTVTGITVGTPTYMSPEQAVGERELDGRCDVYSLGVLGYQMLTGRVPFSAANSMALLLKHVTERPPHIADLRPDAPSALRATIERALMKAPEDRWPTASAFRDALRSDDVPGPTWRADQREPVRYLSPIPGVGRRDTPLRSGGRASSLGSSPRRGVPTVDRPPAHSTIAGEAGAIILEPAHLASLNPAQRDDIRLWHGRIHLLDRIKAMRGYALVTMAATVASLVGFVAGVSDGIVPLIVAPVIPYYMMRKLWRRGVSLRQSGLRLRRVLLMPRAQSVLAASVPVQAEQHVEKLAPRETLESAQGAAIRRAAADRAVILDILANLPKAERALLPDLEPTVNALASRVGELGQLLHRLDQDFDPGMIAEFDARIAEVRSEQETTAGQRRLALLERQRGTLEELGKRRAMLVNQLESATLSLGSLRLDLVKVRSSGLQSALTDVSSATQEARTLSREIGVMLEAAAEVRSL
jgi:serine/threonine-protein kinase